MKSFYIVSYLLVAILLISAKRVLAQNLSTDSGKYYRVNKKVELPIATACIIGSYFGFQQLDKRSAYTAEDLKRLDPSKVNFFDRPVISYNPAAFESAMANSDFFLNFSIASPAILLLDKKARHNSLDLLALFMVAHTVDNAIYFASAYTVRRARPFTYNTALSEEYRTGLAKSNSFFSGHVSFSATATTFAAKVYTDYHQIKGWKRLAIFTMAEVPPALVGYYRIRSARHFRSDVLIGMIVGTACGIGVPELHHRANKNNKLSLSPIIAPGYNGFALNVKL